jgi:carboxylesterase
MTDFPPPVPDPFDYSGNSVGILLIHGFTGSPSEFRSMGQYLSEQGYTVVGPLLPGHGTTWQDMARRRWQEWANAAEQVYLELKGRCRTVLVGGGSMGGLLTLYLAERHPEIAGIIPMAPALFTADWRAGLAWLIKYFVQFNPYDPERDGDDLTDPEARQRYLWSYMGTPVAAAEQLVLLQHAVRRDLRKIAAPTLIFQGTRDRSVKLQSAVYAFNRIAAKDKELIWLTNSGHCLWVDSEKEQVWQKTHQFIAAHASNPNPCEGS